MRVVGAELEGGGALFVLFDARLHVPSLFLFPVRRDGEGAVEGGSASFVNDTEAGMVVAMAVLFSATVVGSGIAGEKVGETEGPGIRGDEWRRCADRGRETGGVAGRGEDGKEREKAGHEGAGEGGRERAKTEGEEGAGKG